MIPSQNPEEGPDYDPAFEEAVRREVQHRLAAMQIHWAETGQQAMAEALVRLDALREALEQGQSERQVELAKSMSLLEEDRLRLRLRGIGRRLFEDGHTAAQIARWLDLPEETLRDWLPEPHRAGQPAAGTEAGAEVLRDACLDYQDQGRGGTIRFVGGKTAFTMWWEYAGGAATALIGIPSGEEWEARTGIPLSLREEVLAFIGGRILRDKMGGRGRWACEGQTLTIHP